MSVEKNTPNFLKHAGLGFTTIINETMDLIPDAAALGIYCYLASKPADWNICSKHLQNRFNMGRDAIRKKMNILRDVGLMQVESVRDEKGQIIQWNTTLRNQITENQYSGEKSRLLKIQNLDNPESGKTAPTNKRALKKKEEKNKRESALPESFKPNQECQAIAESKGLSASDVFEKFKAHAKANGWKRTNWDEACKKWFLSEKHVSTSPAHHNDEIKNTVPDWGPGHPGWESLNNFDRKQNTG